MQTPAGSLLALLFSLKKGNGRSSEHKEGKAAEQGREDPTHSGVAAADRSSRWHRQGEGGPWVPMSRGPGCPLIASSE